MKKNTYNDMTVEELAKSIKSEKAKYLRMQFNHSVSPLASPIELRKVRRNIARMITQLNAKTK